ncbi:MAG: aguA [Anaerocolumna sp.]|jgi:agmatine deiminase|nr:aguA [Anaerocolumna sp.]
MEQKIFYMPAEWEEHERSFIEWPVKDSLVWEDNYEEVMLGYKEVAKAISDYEEITIIANPNENSDILNECKEFAQIIEIPHNDAWCRDNGPTFIWNEEKVLKGVNWKFNAWGEKYKPYDLDDMVASKVLDHYKVPIVYSSIVLEGGSIHVDGEGTMITTMECLLNKNRNPHLSKEQIEEEVKSNLGVEKIIWLNHGLFGDETDGHVDNIACFAKPGVVLIQTCKDESDPNYEITRENIEILRNEIDARGRAFEIIEIPQPPVRYYKEERLTLSYLNFYFVNKGIILPVFYEDAQETDRAAIEILQNVFPDRNISVVDGMKLIKEGGNVHCITQQLPKGLR